MTADEDVIAITITNDRGASLPDAGGAGTALFIRLGLMLIGFAGAVFMVRRRRGRASS